MNNCNLPPPHLQKYKCTMKGGAGLKYPCFYQISKLAYLNNGEKLDVAC